jgi:ATP-dependent Clp protease ATP-binding subunit ClpX
MAQDPSKRCNFCGRPRNEVKNLIGSPDGSNICNTCIVRSAETLRKEELKSAAGQPAQKVLKKPREITALLDRQVIGQAEAKRELAIAVYRHYRRREVEHQQNGAILLDGEAVEIEKSNILLLGPSGSGKTLLARAIARMLDVPFFVADATRLTQAGYVGDDVESILQGLFADSQQDVERAQWGIVFLDEFDKLARKSGRSASGYRDVTGEGVQQSLLKLLEGSKVPVPRGQGSRAVSGMSTIDVIDTTNILFICAGSFAGIEPLIEQRLNKSSGMGFGQEGRKKFEKSDLYHQVTVQDLEEFGLIPEIVGRLPIVSSTFELTEAEMIDVLVKPDHSLCKQFRALFSLDGIDLQFDPEALLAIARKAKQYSTGARALRTVVEQVLKPYSYEAPEDQDIASIRITAEAVAKPGSAVVMRKSVAHG